MQGVECFFQDMQQQRILDIPCLQQYRAQAMDNSRPKGFLFCEVGNQTIGSFLFFLNTSQESDLGWAVGFF